ncbi:hypothetical protein C8R43DRAFT_1097128 [Mycena crocata]|nr:hypothetical protein C8R43DRAFT_1097128 [Mycena crocata]
MSVETTLPVPTRGALLPYEIWWRDRQQWLETRGYMLRPRFRPGWTPSWIAQKTFSVMVEDGQILKFGKILDAIRVEDGHLVTFKKIQKSVPEYAAETNIGLYFSTPPRAAHPHNHCIPTYEVLQIPDDAEHELIVMPALRRFTSPPFDTFGEVVECLRQIFQGIQFMHAHHVAHRDCSSYNIMMDATKLYPNGFHPSSIDDNRNYKGKASYTMRTECNPKYYLIDFGISRMYDPARGPPLDYAVLGGDKTLPECQEDNRNKLHDPFPTDIYYLGNMVRREFIKGSRFTEGYSGFGFIEPLIADMTAKEPSTRLTIDEVVVRFDQIRRSLNAWKLRSRPIPLKEFRLVTLFRAIPHWLRRISYILRGIPPVPVP